MRLLEAYRGGYEGRPGWWLSLTYSEHGIERLKAEIPAAQRTWDPDRKLWWVSDEALPAALRIVPSLEAFTKQGSLFGE